MTAQGEVGGHLSVSSVKLFMCHDDSSWGARRPHHLERGLHDAVKREMKTRRFSSTGYDVKFRFENTKRLVVKRVDELAEGSGGKEYVRLQVGVDSNLVRNYSYTARHRSRAWAESL